MKENTYTVYIDVFFLINFLMDYLILHLTFKVMHKQYKKVRMILGAIFGGCYSVAILLPLFNHLCIVTFLSIFVGFIMVVISLGRDKFTEYLKLTFFLLCISFLMGGLMNYLYYSTEMGIIVLNVLNGNSAKAINTKKFIFVTGLAYIGILLIVKYVKIHKRNEGIIFEVKLTYNGKSVVTKGLLDTGNTLVEPITGEIVHIAEYKIIKPIIEGVKAAKENIYVIPYNSVGKEDGVLYGFKIDEMVILINDEPKFVYKPILGIYNGKISEKNKFSIIFNGSVMERF